MAQELIYTSAPKGLLPGSSGFCTVARSAGLSHVLTGQLESLSGYRHLFQPQSETAHLNPVAWSHWIARFGNTPVHILSRVADAGLDYTKRSNVIAHHLVLKPDDLTAAGPAWVLEHSNLFVDHWNNTPLEFPVEKTIPKEDVKPKKCTNWEDITGDAGWGGVLAETALNSRPVCIVFRPGMQVLPLISESITLLPESVRWKVSFSTYLTELPSGISCQWKCVIGGTPESRAIRATKDVLVIDLLEKGISVPKTDSPFVELARTGKIAPPKTSRVQEQMVPPPVVAASPQQLDTVEVPAIHGDIFDVKESPHPKRKRPKTGDWDDKYSAKAIETQRERKAKRIFLTALGLASLAILVLLTLLADQLFNSGGIRKAFADSARAMFARSEKPSIDVDMNDDNQKREPANPIEDEPAKEETIIPEKTPEEIEAEKAAKEETERLKQEEQLKAEQEEQQRIETEKRIEEARLARNAAMQKAFESLPEIFQLSEPRTKPFGGVELSEQLQPKFADLFPYHEFVRFELNPIIVPKGWKYKLDELPTVWKDEKFKKWNLTAINENGSSVQLCTLLLGNEGLEFQWNDKTAGLESNISLVSKLPFSYLRVVFDPKENIWNENFLPSSIDSYSEFAAVKDIPLFEPVIAKPYLIDRSSELNKATNPVAKIDNVFVRDRWRVALDDYDIQPLLRLEISVEPDRTDSITTAGFPPEQPDKRMITITTDVLTKSDEPIVIPISAEASTLAIQFRDHSHDAVAKASADRRNATRLKKEKSDELAAIQPTKDNEKQRKELQVEIDAADKLYNDSSDVTQKIPQARKKMNEAGLAIHYSITLQTETGLKLPILKTE